MRYLLQISLTLMMMLAVILSAEPWKISTDIGLSLSQSAYSDNWAGSELGAVSWTASSNSVLEKQLNSVFYNRNTLKLSFGQTHQQKVNSMGEKYWDKPLKSTDKTDFESLLNMNVGIYVDPFVAFRWESQFLDESDPTQAIIFNPTVFTESAGLSRTFVKDDYRYLNSRIGFAFRQFVNRDVLDPITNAVETIQANDGGVEFIAEYELKIPNPDAKVTSKLNLYQAMVNSESDDLNDDWKAIDVKWENTLSAKLWGALSLNLGLELKYEKQEAKDLQLKQTMGLGISYRLF